ncbi:hypothetical protein [Duganella phyllosphaerae]|uniref:hypothetical protein n=1 Tax=Duganella phyllosphaerae TaxID=762836 RepID=UPI001428AB4B|nr:hypothetical protein [Duganella phyllosphaerae]
MKQEFGFKVSHAVGGVPKTLTNHVAEQNISVKQLARLAAVHEHQLRRVVRNMHFFRSNTSAHESAPSPCCKKTSLFTVLSTGE